MQSERGRRSRCALLEVEGSSGSFVRCLDGRGAAGSAGTPWLASHAVAASDLKITFTYLYTNKKKKYFFLG
jgi:hypothetical protein